MGNLSMNRRRRLTAAESGYHGRSSSVSRRGILIVAIMVLLLVIELIIVTMVISGARDHDLTIRRLQTVESFYASEAGINMAIREITEPDDEDGDSKIGGISDDSNPATDPALGNAYFFVTATTVGATTTLVSEGRSGDAMRTAQATVR